MNSRRGATSLLMRSSKTEVATSASSRLTRRRLGKSGKRWQEPVQRYKGLGEMDAEQLATTTMDRGGRTLRRVRLEDAEVATSDFELLMGNEVAPRREFIVSSSDRLSREAIDA